VGRRHNLLAFLEKTAIVFSGCMPRRRKLAEFPKAFAHYDALRTEQWL
jgi:hypothetical protein